MNKTGQIYRYLWWPKSTGLLLVVAGVALSVLNKDYGIYVFKGLLSAPLFFLGLYIIMRRFFIAMMDYMERNPDRIRGADINDVFDLIINETRHKIGTNK